VAKESADTGGCSRRKTKGGGTHKEGTCGPEKKREWKQGQKICMESNNVCHRHRIKGSLRK